MATYHGGKKRIGKDIAKLIADIYNKLPVNQRIKITTYCEPFCGMLGVYSNVIPLLSEKDDFTFYAGDTNGSVIKMWQEAATGKWSPPSECSREEFEKLKHDGQETANKGFIGFVWAYRSKYFVSYFPNAGNGRIEKNRADVLKISKVIGDVNFEKGDYTQFSLLENAIIYCDPPYSSSNQYYDDNRVQIPFSNEKFWDWVRIMSQKNIVIVSEYEAPKDFRQIWASGVEKLFIYNHNTNKNAKN